MSKEVPDDVKAYIRAVLLSAPKGVKQTKFPREYENFANSKIEWRKMGFVDLYEFLLAIPDVARLEYSKKDAQNIIFGVNKKDIYTSSHAKKAGMKGTGAKPRHPSEWDKQPANNSPDKQKNKMTSLRTVNVDASSVKITVVNSSDLATGTLSPNDQGLFGVYIGDMPKGCTKEELESVFREYPSLKLCKIVTNVGRSPKACAFAKFSAEQDALRAIKEKNGFALRGSNLSVRAAKEHSTKQSETKTAAAQKAKSPPKNTAVPPQNSNDIFNEIELKQIYSRFGVVQSIQLQSDRKTAILKFGNQGEALITLKNMKELTLDWHVLELSSQPGNETSLKVHIKDINSRDNSRPNSSASSSLSPGVNSPQGSFFNINDSSANQSTKQTITNSTNQGLKTQSNQYPKPLQQHHQQQQQHQQRSPSSGYKNPGNFSTSIPSGKNIHSFLTKEEMEKLCKDAGHPLKQRFEGLPDEMDVLVTEVVDPCRFWAIFDNKAGNWQQLQDLELHLQKTRICSNTVPVKFTIGAGRFTENNVWYRCFVLDVSPDEKNVKVLYTDYGNMEWIPLERFSSLESLYLSLPPQANAFHLAGMELNYSNSPEMLKEGTQYLKHLIGDKTLIAKRKPPTSPFQPHIVEVELFLKTQPSKSVNELMLETAYVIKVNTKQDKQDSLVNKRFKLKIAWVQSPTHIFYYPATFETERALREMEFALSTISEADIAFPTIGAVVCMILKDFSRRRARILDTCLIGGTIKSVKIQCIDHGNIIKEAHITNLLRLPDALRVVPPIAIEAFMEGLKLPSNLNTWPKEAMDVMMNVRDQLLDGIMVRRRGSNYIDIFDSNGELLNKRIQETIDQPVPKELDVHKSIGATPMSAKTVSMLPDTSILPKPNRDSMATSNKNVVTSHSGQTASNSSPCIRSISDKMSQQQSNSPSQGVPLNADFYMPPPPIDHKGRLSPQRAPHVSSPPNEAQRTYHSPQGTQNVNYSPQGAQGVDGPPHGTCNKFSPQGSHSGNRQGTQNFNSPAQGTQFQNSLTKESQGIRTKMQSSEVGASIPQGAHVRNNMQQGSQSMDRNNQTNDANNFHSPKTVNASPLINNDTKQINSTSYTPPQQAKTNVPSVNGNLSQLSIHEALWTKERESLLANRKEQEQYIESLSKVEQPKVSTPNLQELKVKLAKQVRIKELENQVLKLRKEVESLESTKAKLQLHLMNA